MPKENVDQVTLIAGQELGDVIAPKVNDYLTIWPTGSLLGFKISIDNFAQLVSSVLGSGSLLPERRYLIDTVMPGTSSYEVNGDGNGQINDSYLDGKVYDVHRNGLLIAKGVIWDNDVVGGGVRLLQASDTLEIGEEILITFQPQFSSYIPSVDAIARFTLGEQIMTASGLITEGMYRKIIRLQANGPSRVLSAGLPPASSYPKNVALYIVSDGGVQYQSTVYASGSDTIFYDGVELTEIYLGRNDQLSLLVNAEGTGWIVQMFKTGWDRTGSVDWGYIPGPNHYVATNTAPALRAEWPRVMDFIRKLYAIQPASVLSGAEWVNDTGKWGLGDGDINTGTTFNFPYLAGEFARWLDPDGEIDVDRAATDESNVGGSKQSQQLVDHSHDYEGPKLKSNSDAGGNPDQVDKETKQTGGVKGIPAEQIGTEIRPRNIGGLPLINT